MQEEKRTTAKKPYHTPELTEHGSLKNMTLGGSPGVNDSTPPNTDPI
jgi:hypothetical protein